VKLPGGAGGSHVGALATHFAIWSVRHEARTTSKGKRIYNFVDEVDFITTMGHRTRKGTRQQLGLQCGGPDVVVTNLCVFDFDPASLTMRLKSLHPGVNEQEVRDNTGFEPVIPADLNETAPPTVDEIRIIRDLDPLETRKRGFSEAALAKRFDL
jgi:acyl CoA:acetate/3-ketoacid CoA transferase beta subunit